MTFWRRLLLLLPWRRRAAERDMQDELRSIAAMAEPRELGNLSLAAEDARAEWGWPSVERLRVDVRHAVVGFRSHRGATALAFAILTLTLAAGTVTFSVVDAIALRPLPYGDPDGLVAVARQARPDDDPGNVSTQDYVAWRDRVRSFDGFAAVVPDGIRRVDSSAAPQELRTARVSASLFDVLRVRPALGRFFRLEDETPGHDDVAIVAHSAWVRAFNADPSIVGRRVTLASGQAHTTVEIVGVLSPGVTYPPAAIEPFELFLPYVPGERDRMYALPARAFFVDVVGRLKPGVTLDEAHADIERATAAVRASFDMADPPWGGTVVVPLHDRVVGKAKGWLLLVLAAVGCVVLVGCVNAASLLLSRATARACELSTRAALGASRGRLVRTLLAEGFLLAFAASGVATALSYWGVRMVKASLPDGLARASTIAVDARVLAMVTAAAVSCGLFTGAAPAWRIARASLFDQLRVGGGVTGGRWQSQALGAFLVAEVAFVSVLLVVTTLLVASFVVVTTTDLGFDRRNVVTMGIRKSIANDLPRDTQRDIALTFFGDVLDRAQAVPGVASAGLIGIGSAPLAGTGSSARYSLEIPGFGETPRGEWLETRAISPEYFAAIGLRVLRGRAFTVEDHPGAPAVAIINELAARRFFAGRDPVGEVVRFNGAPTRIVGVVQDLRIQGPEADPIFELYLPFAQFLPTPLMALAQLVVRTTASPVATVSAVRDAIRPALGPEKFAVQGRMIDSMSEPRFFDESFRELTAARRFNAGLMSIFGVIAIVIGAIGIYGTMAFAVVQETKAIGLRMALGATQSDVLRSILWAALWRVSLGAVLGLIAARAVSSLFAALVFGVTPTSPAAYAGVALGLAALGLVAALVPARRAARVDPLTALRAE